MSFSTEIEALPQQFLEGLRVLVIDHDTTIHNAIVQKSIGWDYKVTTCSNASFALTLLREAKGFFDVILIEEQISDMNSYDFLQQITQQINIPVIMMGVDGSTSAMMKAIANGACEYCVKPFNDDLIKNICKHVAKKSMNENKHDQINVDNGTKETQVDVVEKDNYEPPTKKNRLTWSQAMHKEFLRAVNQFGLDNATPKKIIEVMNVPGLTRENVASHLQKLRLTLKRSFEVTQLKNEIPKGKRPKSKQDECHLSSETQLGLEAAKSTPKLDQNVQNSVIQCHNNSHVPQHSPTFANTFTDQFNIPNSVIQCDKNCHAPQHSQTFANIFQNSVIQCDKNSHAPQHSQTFADIFTDQPNVQNLVIQCDNNSHVPQHSPTFANTFTDQFNIPNSVIQCDKNCHAPQHSQIFANIFTDQPNVPNVQNSVIQCDKNSHSPQHSQTFANSFTDQSNFQNSVIQWDKNSHAPQHSQTFADIFTDQPNVQNSVIQCDKNSHAQLHSPTFANIFTHQSNVQNSVKQCDNNSHAPQHSPIFTNIFTDQSDVLNSVIQYDNNSHAQEHSLVNIFTGQSSVLNSFIQCDNNYHVPQHSPTFANFFTDQSNMNLGNGFFNLLFKE